MLARLDLLTRKWWRAVGRPVDLRDTHSWLDAPIATASPVGDGWMAAEAGQWGGTVRDGVAGAGLLEDAAALDGPSFAADDLHPAVRSFYEETSAWRMEVWAGWRPWFWPGGELISQLFGRRVGQLAIPHAPSTSPAAWTAASV